MDSGGRSRTKAYCEFYFHFSLQNESLVIDVFCCREMIRAWFVDFFFRFDLKFGFYLETGVFGNCETKKIVISPICYIEFQNFIFVRASAAVEHFGENPLLSTSSLKILTHFSTITTPFCGVGVSKLVASYEVLRTNLTLSDFFMVSRVEGLG